MRHIPLLILNIKQFPKLNLTQTHHIYQLSSHPPQNFSISLNKLVAYLIFSKTNIMNRDMTLFIASSPSLANIGSLVLENLKGWCNSDNSYIRCNMNSTRLKLVLTLFNLNQNLFVRSNKCISMTLNRCSFKSRKCPKHVALNNSLCVIFSFEQMFDIMSSHPKTVNQI